MAVSSQVAVASWKGTRFFAVDNDAGDDSNVGYSDVSLALAGATPLKTLERLWGIVSKLAGGQRLYIVGKARADGAAYKKQDGITDDDVLLDGFTGYQGIWVRGTADVPSAGAVAFSDSAADRIAAGGRILPGTNAAGYNATGVPTVSTFDVQLAGGGAPGLAAEPALEHKRIRFDVATLTPALRNVCRAIWANDTDTMTVDADLPAVPVPGAAGDVFYIEEPGFACARVVERVIGASNIGLPDVTFQFGACTTVGVRGTSVVGTSGVITRGSSFNFSFCDFAHPGTLAWTHESTGQFFAQSGWAAPDGTFVGVGTGFRSVGTFQSSATGGSGLFIGNSGVVSPTHRFIANASFGAANNLGAGCYAGGASLQNFAQFTLGRGLSVASRPLRTEGPGSAGRVISLPVGGANGSVICDGIQTLNAGASSLYRLAQAYQVGVRFKDCTGSVGNTGTGLDCNSATMAGCEIVFDTGNTFTGSLGNDILTNGDVRYAHADYAITDFYDRAGNHYGPNVRPDNGFGSFVVPGKGLDNDGTTVLVQFGVAKLGTLTGQFRMARADSFVNASGVLGIRQNLGGVSSMIVGAGHTWIQFDAVPVRGNLAYLSEVTAGNARDTPPPMLATNQKLRLGRIYQVSGTRGLVAWNPDPFPVLSDGVPP
jgi:hypothetical protein